MSWWDEWRPVITMLFVDISFSVTNILIKKVIDDGMKILVLITLRQLIATLFLAPIAFFCERKTRPEFTSEICIYIFFSAIFGAALTQYLFYLGLLYTSTTFACAFLNLTPTFTFLIALVLRLETMNLKRVEGKMKVAGTTICLFGVILLTVYRGAALTNIKHSTLTSKNQSQHDIENSSRKWFMGSIALIGGCLCWSFWFPLQAKLGKKYPALYSSTVLIFFFGFLQSAAMSLSLQRDLSVWLLKKKMEIITVVFSGIIASGLSLLAMSWCMKKRGPVFTAAFIPLVQVIVAGIDFSVLHEDIHLGSVLGSVLVASGLYLLLWGKAKEARSSLVLVQEEGKPEGNVENHV